jgi:hypothetical protein
MNDLEINVLKSLKSRGFAVIIIEPDELKNASADKVEDRLIELSWDIINDLDIE